MNQLAALLKRLGPGFITGISDNDPSGIGTYAQTGAQFGYRQLWLAPAVFPFMLVVQNMCGRLGLVTGKGLATLIATHYNRKLLFGAVALLFIANTVNIGADLGAMADTMQLITGWHHHLWLILLALLTITLEVFLDYAVYARYLKVFAMSVFAYVAAMVLTHHPWGSILQALWVPQLSLEGPLIFNSVAVLGTTISPYLFFWQASEEVEEEISDHKLADMDTASLPTIDQTDLQRLSQDTALGMGSAAVVMFAIIVTTASTLHHAGMTHIETAAQAAEALRPIAGTATYLLFAAGIVGTGLLGIPVLAASSAYALSETMGWHEGLSLKLNKARGFYGTIIIGTLLGLLINLLNIPPFTMLYYTAILNGLCAPPLLVFIVCLSSRQDVMGAYKNSWVSLALGWVITGVMGVFGLLLLGQWLGVLK